MSFLLLHSNVKKNKKQLVNEEYLVKVLEGKAIQIFHVFPKVGQVAVGFGFLRWQ